MIRIIEAEHDNSFSSCDDCPLVWKITQPKVEILFSDLSKTERKQVLRRKTQAGCFDDDPAEQVIEAEQRKVLEGQRNAMVKNGFTLREKEVYVLMFGLTKEGSLTKEEIAKKLGLTKQRIGALEEQVFGKLARLYPIILANYPGKHPLGGFLAYFLRRRKKELTDINLRAKREKLILEAGGDKQHAGKLLAELDTFRVMYEEMLGKVYPDFPREIKELVIDSNYPEGESIHVDSLREVRKLEKELWFTLKQ